MERRDFMKRSALAGAGLVLGTQMRTDTALAAPACSWGARTDPYKGETVQRATLDFEAKIGRKIAIVREYSCWDRDLPDHYDTWAGNRGLIPMIAWHARTSGGGVIPWASIAKGAHDARIRNQARSLKAWGKKAYFCFHHEPENDHANGGPAEFRAAWSRVHHIFGSVGTPNLTWVPTFMASTYRGGHGGIGRWMPLTGGTLFGVDGYNRGACDPAGWRTFDEIFRAARNYARAKGHGLFIPEFGCVEDGACTGTGGDPTRKAAWITRAASTITSWPEVRGVVYSNTEWVFKGAHVNYRVTTSKQSLTAYRAAGELAHFT
jgi:hypothetical protein